MRMIMIAAAVLIGSGVVRAGDLDIHVLLSGQVAPGVYGQVQLGNGPSPRLVYAQPMLIEAQPAPPPPIYLHVPPGHARNWRKHCHEYNACNRPVYFVRSQEYDPGYVRRGPPERHRDQDYDRGRDAGHGRGQGEGHGEGHGDGHGDGHGHNRDEEHDRHEHD